MQVKERKKDKLQKLRFYSRAVVAAGKYQKALINSKLSLKIQEIIGGDRLNRRDVLEGKFEIDLDKHSKDYKFPFLQITTDLLNDEGGPVTNKILVL